MVMIKIKIIWRECEKHRKQKTFKITYHRFKEVFDMVDNCEEPLWFEFEFFLLEAFWRDTDITNKKGITTYYDNKKPPSSVSNWEGKELKQFYIQIMRDNKLNYLGIK